MMGRPVFFIHQRAGFKGNPFNIIKFRTMTLDCNEGGQLLSDMDRLTLWGSFLRKLSLDELPQLINIIKGEMSFIGPRPLLIDYLDKYNDFQKKRHDVKPGITGLAQVNGRNALSWNDRFNYDVDYVNHYGFMMDIKIFIKTMGVVVMRRGINNSAGETMGRFEGN
jgi:lipopolysaccharide/colanic/teichoic acid biosynthesis glycosyltransferase